MKNVIVTTDRRPSRGRPQSGPRRASVPPLIAEQMVATNRELERQNADLRVFAHIASHDLREPTRKLIAYSTALAEDLGDDLPPAVAAHLDRIIAAATRMTSLVDALLDLAETERAESECESVALDDCVDDALSELADVLDGCRAVVTRDALPDVCCNSMLVAQLYQNLVGNAVKFVRGRAPEVHLTAEAVGEGWVFGVRDNGIGVDLDAAHEIFAPFRRLHGCAEYPGSGIGLSICQKVVERHGGQIWVDPAPGGGSHFRFTLG